MTVVSHVTRAGATPPPDRSVVSNPLLDDNPARRDVLGFDRLQQILVTIIRDPPRLPFTIGIFAEWGSGKTTLMQMIRDGLDADGVKTVWFNAWKYDSKEIIWNALIQQIFYTMSTDPEVKKRADADAFRKRVTDVAKGLARYAAKVATRFVPGGVIKEEDVDTVIDAFSTSAADEEFAFINRFEDHFDRLVSDYVGEDGYLVVFIDDLDRCLPENAINAMEALKLYLDRANCIFVIGAERSIVEEGIRQRYKDNVNLSAEAYLDKIIQLPFVLPRPGTERALQLLTGSLAGYDDDETMRKLILEGTGSNPRRVKRFSNAFWVLSQIAGDLEPADALRLAKVLLIQMRFPRMFDRLRADEGAAATMVDALEHGPNAVTDLAQRSPELAPLLADANLTRFLRNTSTITMAEEETNRWIALADAQSQS